MKASSESGLCATFISRIVFSALLIGDKATFPLKTGGGLLSFISLTLIDELDRALQSPCDCRCNHYFHDFGKHERQQTKSHGALPTLRNHCQPSDSAAKQDNLSHNASPEIASERRNATFRKPSCDERNDGIGKQIAAGGTEELCDPAKSSRTEDRQSHGSPSQI